MNKKIFLIAIFAIISCTFFGCKMKDCTCVSSNEVYAPEIVTIYDSLNNFIGYDTVINIVSFSFDSVSNSTRDNCTDFNVDEIVRWDSARYVHHIMTCTEE